MRACPSDCSLSRPAYAITSTPNVCPRPQYAHTIADATIAMPTIANATVWGTERNAGASPWPSSGDVFLKGRATGAGILGALQPAQGDGLARVDHQLPRKRDAVFGYRQRSRTRRS